MSLRQLSPFCLATFLACLGLSPQRVTAGFVDIWVDCPCIPVVCWQFLPTAPAQTAMRTSAKPKLAQPRAAPPSVSPITVALEKKSEAKPAVSETAKPETGAIKQGAAVREEGPFYDTYAIALKNDQKPANDQCSVTFMNLSDRPIKVMVENQERTLAKGASETLPVKRQFVWRMEGREPQNEQVGTGDYALQIVIRR